MVFDYTNTEFSMCRGRQRCQGSLIDSRYLVDYKSDYMSVLLKPIRPHIRNDIPTIYRDQVLYKMIKIVITINIPSH